MGSLIKLIGIYENASDFTEFYIELQKRLDLLEKIIDLLDKRFRTIDDLFFINTFYPLKQGLNNLIGVSASFYNSLTNVKKKQGSVYTKKPICRFINDQALLNYHSISQKKDYDLNFDENVILGLKILDPACGAGFFLLDLFFLLLTKVLNGIITEKTGAHEVSLRKIAFNLLERVIYGMDIDEKAILNAQTVFKSIFLYLVYEQPIEIKSEESLKKNTYKRIQDVIESNIHTSNFLLMDKNEYKDFFDVIVGNPPYIRVHKMDPTLSVFLRKNYYVPVKDFDIYICFFEQAINFIKPGGVIGFITPDKYLLRQYAYKLRQLLLETVQLREIVDVSRCRDVFDAFTYPLITILSKNEEKKVTDLDPSKNIGIYLRIEDNFLEKILETTKIINKFLQKNKMDDFNHNSIRISLITEGDIQKFRLNPFYEFDFITNKVQKQLEEIFSSYLILGDVGDSITIFCGTPRAKNYHTLSKNIYDRLEPKHKRDLKYIVSHNIIPFSIIWGIPINSIGQKYLHPYYDIDETHEAMGFGNQLIERFKITPKILVKANSKRLTTAIDSTSYASNGIYGIIPKGKIFESFATGDPNSDIILLTALFNSDLVNYYIINKFQSYMLNSNYLSVNSAILRSIPIPVLKHSLDPQQTRISPILLEIESINHIFVDLTGQLNKIIKTYNNLENKDQNDDLELLHDILSQVMAGIVIKNIQLQFPSKFKHQNFEEEIVKLSKLYQNLNQEMYNLFNIPISIQAEINQFFKK
jgi:hypothetical protein